MTTYTVTGEGTAKSLLAFDSLTVTVNGAISTTYATVVLTGDGGWVNNAGTLSSSQGMGISGSSGSGQRIVNSGTITGPTGIQLTNGTLEGVFANIVNSGTITGLGSSIYITSGGNTIQNSGTIAAFGQIGINITSRFMDPGLELANVIINSGTIYATVLTGTAKAIYAEENADTVVNSGTIRGAVSLGEGDNTLNNTGWIVGNVILGAGNDTVTNHGKLDGIVTLGDGSNTFDGRGGTVSGYVQGGAGSDLYQISDGAIVLIEGAGEPDTVDAVQTTDSYKLEENFEQLQLMGNAAIDGTGNTTRNLIYGNSANNRLSGLGGADNLLGYDGDDRLLGGTGDDLLVGMDGDDRLLGGAGADTMIGGDGADIFVFQRRADSTTTTADRITDFAVGDDLIDLGSFAGTFAFRGTGPFVAGGAQIRVVQATTTQVLIDLNGDLASDMRILLSGNIALHASDFIL